MIEWLVFLVTLVPFIELRGAIPLALLYNPGLSPLTVLAVCVALNTLVIPIAFFILDLVLPPVRRRVEFVDRLFRSSVKRARKHRNLSLVGLALFVSIPLPVTGAYTASLIVYIAGLDRRSAALAIGGGIALAGALVWILTAAGISLISGFS